MKRMIALAFAITAIAVTSPRVIHAEHDPRHGEICDEGSAETPDGYFCGEIVVKLFDDSDATIEEVVARNGGDDGDIIRRTENLNIFTIAVPVDSEREMRDQYEEDPAVERTQFNLVGSTVPDTAAALPSRDGRGLVAIVGLVTLLGAFRILARHRSGAAMRR